MLLYLFLRDGLRDFQNFKCKSEERFRDSPEKYFCGPPDIRYTGKNRSNRKLPVSRSLYMLCFWFFYHSASNFLRIILRSNFVIWPQKGQIWKMTRMGSYYMSYGRKNIFRVNPETFPLTYFWNFENPSSHLREKGTVATIDLKKNSRHGIFQ